jgi:hypothetical protein
VIQPDVLELFRDAQGTARVIPETVLVHVVDTLRLRDTFTVVTSERGGDLRTAVVVLSALVAAASAAAAWYSVKINRQSAARAERSELRDTERETRHTKARQAQLTMLTVIVAGQIEALLCQIDSARRFGQFTIIFERDLLSRVRAVDTEFRKLLEVGAYDFLMNERVATIRRAYDVFFLGLKGLVGRVAAHWTHQGDGKPEGAVTEQIDGWYGGEYEYEGKLTEALDLLDTLPERVAKKAAKATETLNRRPQFPG